MILHKTLKDHTGKVISQTVYRGLGDRVAAVAKPIARAIDKVLPTKLEDCVGCLQRQEWLNKHFPSKDKT